MRQLAVAKCRYGSKADTAAAICDIRLSLQSGHGCTLVKQPRAVFCRRKFLIAVLTCRHYARRGLAANDDIFRVAARAAEAVTCRGPVRAPLKNALQNRPALGGHFAAARLNRGIATA